MNRLALAAAAALTLCAAPAFAAAQDAPAAAAPIADQPPVSPEESAFQAKGEVFEAEAERMGVELETIMSDENLDAATKKARTDAVLDRYEPVFMAFADEYDAFMRAMAERPEHAENKAQILSAAQAGPAALRAVPTQLRGAIGAALAEAASAD